MQKLKKQPRKSSFVLFVLIVVLFIGGVVYAYNPSIKYCPWHPNERVTRWYYTGEHYHSGSGEHTYVFQRVCPLGDYVQTRKDVYACQGTGNGDCNLQFFNIEDEVLENEHHH